MGRYALPSGRTSTTSLTFQIPVNIKNFSDWAKEERDKPKTIEKIERLKSKLKHGQQSRSRIQKDTEEYLIKRFGGDSDHNLRFNYSIDLSQATERKFLESRVTKWWYAEGGPVCYLEGKEGMGKSWLAAKCVNSICSDKHVVTFWLDSSRWSSCKSLDDLLQTCLETMPGYQDEKKDYQTETQNSEYLVASNTHCP